MAIKTEWNLSSLFKNDNDPAMQEARKAIRAKTDAFIAKWKERQDWLMDAKVLAEALKDYEDWHKDCAMGGAEGYYFEMRSAQDENDPALKAKLGKVEEFALKVGTEMQFFTMRLAKAGGKEQALFLGAPELAGWKHFLERLFAEAKYLLSEPEEKIMTLKYPPAAANWERMVSGFISREERDGKSFEELLNLSHDRDKAARDKAAEGVNDIVAKVADVAEHEMNSLLQNEKIDHELRGIPRPDAERHLADDVDSEVVDALVAAVADNFSISERFYALQAKLMGVTKLKYHERGVPYGSANWKFSFEDACALVQKVFSNLDPEFRTIFDRFLEEGNIDVYPKKNKHGGAFCAHRTLNHPTYVLLNYVPELRQVTTIAHEMGHAINNELQRDKQSDLNFGVPLSTAETASVFMEDFILEEIMRTADDETRLALMMARLQDEVATAFRQIACYRFETELHAAFREKGYLSKANIGALFQKHMSSYMGEAVEQSPGAENWWVYWSHLRHFFYVYSYASGLLVGKAMQAKVKADPAFIAKVKEFLASGLSDSPRNIFLKMGIDIADKNFWKEGIGQIGKLLDETEALAKKLGKIA
jgi:oligoendopeptidase F